MSTPPFEMLTLGPFRREQVLVTQTHLTRPALPEIEAMISATWDEAIETAAAEGKMLFPGPLARLATWTVEAGALHLTLGPTNYRDFLGTNLRRPELRLQYGDDALANAIGVQTILETSDGQLILQRRSMAVMEYPGLLHVCAGSMHPDDGHPFVTIERELAEEHGIAAADILEMTCLGLTRDSRTRKPELCLFTAVDVASAKLLAGRDREYAELIALADDQETLAAFLATQWTACAPGGLATLVAYSATRFMTDIARSWS